MSISRLPSGRWRAQVHDPSVGHNVAVSKILGKGYGSFATKANAKQAREKARALVGSRGEHLVTVYEWWTTWTTDPLWRRPKESTNLHNAERTRAFAKAHENVPICRVDDGTISLWLRGGKRNGQVPALRAMFNDAARPAAGRLVDRNPFANLGIRKSKGNRINNPPSEDIVWALIRAARKVSCPSFATWLQVAAFTGMRPGELDALRWSALDFEAEAIRVSEQFNAAVGAFTSPKNGQARNAPMTLHAKEALHEAPRDDPEFCFVSMHGRHWTAASRAYHWKAVRAATDFDGSLYLATRHFFGAYATNVLLLPAEDVALALGHTDGGYLVRVLYGHRDEAAALDRVRDAYRTVNKPRPPLHIVKKESA